MELRATENYHTILVSSLISSSLLFNYAYFCTSGKSYFNLLRYQFYYIVFILCKINSVSLDFPMNIRNPDSPGFRTNSPSIHKFR